MSSSATALQCWLEVGSLFPRCRKVAALWKCEERHKGQIIGNRDFRPDTEVGSVLRCCQIAGLL